MSPEMFDPEDLGGVSFPADLWAGACVLLQMLTGAVPFAGRQMQVWWQLYISVRELFILFYF